VSFKVITKKDKWPEGLNFAPASARLTSSHLRSLLKHVQTFYPEVEEFYKKMEVVGSGIVHRLK